MGKCLKVILVGGYYCGYYYYFPREIKEDILKKKLNNRVRILKKVFLEPLEFCTKIY